MRGEGRGEGLRRLALVAAPLIRPAATFSPRSAKGEGARARLGSRFARVVLRLILLVVRLWGRGAGDWGQD